MFSLRKEQSIQEKLVEHMILQIVSKESIFGMIDILFNDMKGDYYKLEYGEGSDEEKEETLNYMSKDSDETTEEHSSDEEGNEGFEFISKF